MNGTFDAGFVSANDHDRQFKDLLTTFFVDFLALLFPKLAGSIDPDSIEFLSQEVLGDPLDGEKYVVDIVAKARFKEEECFFLVHVEHQSDAPGGFPRRMFRYFSALLEKYELPVYPIVVYSHDKPRKRQPNVFAIDFPDGRVLRFHYRVVQLNRLSWRKFLNTNNPVASALMAKMKIADRDRPRVKAECLRLILTQKIDPVKMQILASFVDRYLPLSEPQERVFLRSLQKMSLGLEEKEAVMEYVTTWERRGIAKGFEQGRSEGIQQGRSEAQLETLREVLLDLLNSRFGKPSSDLAARVNALASADELRRLTRAVLTASSPSELGL
ncbi:MAG: Rpn family recombination-promoting nuclease/putative transposase [Bryobacterales bacterium]|nr:Rpn family recombination-promoting nuclease/putative transposase [Bryobacterales bacterium]